LRSIRVAPNDIQLLVNRQTDAVSTVDGDERLLPLHFAANWGANLDVIFYLLQHCPNALSHVGNAATMAQAFDGTRMERAIMTIFRCVGLVQKKIQNDLLADSKPTFYIHKEDQVEQHFCYVLYMNSYSLFTFSRFGTLTGKYTYAIFFSKSV
jgi:hypothetical protein